MEDIFDSLIYIVIAIVAFAISVFGKKKKAEARKGTQTGNENNVQRKGKPFLSNLEQLLKEEIGIQDQNNYVDSNSFEDEQEFEEKEEVLDFVPKEMLDDKEDIPYSIEFEDTSEIFSETIKDADLTIQEEEPIIEDFNLREAVIYSEIIKRKDY